MAAKTVAEKLLIKPNATLWMSHTDHLGLIEPVPEGVRMTETPAHADVAILFSQDAAALRELLDTHAEQIKVPAVVWICYPKANRSDINRDTVWPIVGEYGLRPNGQVAINDVWSALRFRPLKPGEAPFAGGLR